MAPSSGKREETIELLRGPSTEVTIVSTSGDAGTWSLPKALLSHHSGYFRRAMRPGSFRESEDNKFTLDDFDPDIFKLFIEFMYYGRCTYRDDLSDKLEVRESAKAWVLGDYLDAVEFKNFAIRDLHDIYFPPNRELPKSGVGPAAIEYCCSTTLADSPLYAIFRDILVVYWHDVNIVQYDSTLLAEWNAIWARHQEIRNDILYYTSQCMDARARRQQSLNTYIEKVAI